MACAKDYHHPPASPSERQCAQKIKISMAQMIHGMFAAATVMISMGAVLGKLSLLQMLVMAIRKKTCMYV
jgi:ammonia channel protein AmtB